MLQKSLDLCEKEHDHLKAQTVSVCHAGCLSVVAVHLYWCVVCSTALWFFFCRLFLFSLSNDWSVLSVLHLGCCVVCFSDSILLPVYLLICLLIFSVCQSRWMSVCLLYCCAVCLTLSFCRSLSLSLPSLSHDSESLCLVCSLCTSWLSSSVCVYFLSLSNTGLQAARTPVDPALQVYICFVCSLSVFFCRLSVCVYVCIFFSSYNGALSFHPHERISVVCLTPFLSLVHMSLSFVSWLSADDSSGYNS